jgi:hypothetical protein
LLPSAGEPAVTPIAIQDVTIVDVLDMKLQTVRAEKTARYECHAIFSVRIESPGNALAIDGEFPIGRVIAALGVGRKAAPLAGDLKRVGFVCGRQGEEQGL